jgi:hypothetical protein
MTLSTQFTLKLLKIRHNNLKFSVLYPRMHKAAKSLVMVAVLGCFVGGYLAFGLGGNNPQVLQANQGDLIIKSYSINGQISSKTGNTIALKANVVIPSGNQSKVVLQDKTVLVTESTKISRVTISGGKVTMSSGSASDLTSGKTVAVYTNSNPAATSVLSADRIELIEQF